MIRLFTILILFLPTLLFGQVSQDGDRAKTTKKHLKGLFKKSTDKYSLSNIWISCNTDQTYFSSDTIKLFNHQNYYYNSKDCCRFVSWKFENPQSFRLSKSYMCTEPPISEVSQNNLFQTNFKNIDGQLYLRINSFDNTVENLKVVDLTKKLLPNEESCYVLTLVRIRKNGY